MKKNEIIVGGHYTAKVSNHLVTVRVDAIRPITTYGRNRYGMGQPTTQSRVYDVTNLSTGRKTTFRSAAKFRRTADEHKRIADIRFPGLTQAAQLEAMESRDI